ncbi:hypothetical protein [Trinickia mobilis]|uniref:hypothetical protein n=1 Tax=Trinickia mobilis TaxID=2816356 RepID=UPI001A8CC7E0|nr:hypothetical protein [Trinickia mobilis]
MRVRELIALLSNADPEAVVLAFQPFADSTEGGEVREVLLPEVPWIHEAGAWAGSRYEVFYPGEAEVRDGSYSTVEVRSMSVVLVGEELGNFRLAWAQKLRPVAPG